MKKHTLLALMFFAFLGVQIRPVYGVSKETLQMMQQLDALQQAIQNLQKTVDTQTAVLKTLVEQANDNVNSHEGNGHRFARIDAAEPGVHKRKI